MDTLYDCLMLLQHTLKCFAQILKQMKAVSNLDCVRRSAGCTVGILNRPVTANDLNTRMALKPGSQAVRGTVRQQVDWLMLFQVNQDCAKHLAFAQRKVIDTKDTRRWRRGRWLTASETEQGGRTD